VANSKDLHLFEYVQRGLVRYIGQMICTGFEERQAPDKKGHQRRIIIFELTPVNAFDDLVSNTVPEEKELWAESLNVLRERALATSYTARTPSERKQLVHYRSSAVRTYVLKRANGICEGCGKEAPFKTNEGKPYLEPHHLRRLSDGGPDHPSWVAALCPNCHRRAHYSVDKVAFNKQLMRIVGEKEQV